MKKIVGKNLDLVTRELREFLVEDFTEVKDNKRRINTPIIKLEYETDEFSHGDVVRIEYELLTMAINIKSYFVNSHGTRLFVEFNLEQRG